jgi:hypothetical protein
MYCSIYIYRSIELHPDFVAPLFLLLLATTPAQLGWTWAAGV